MNLDIQYLQQVFYPELNLGTPDELLRQVACIGHACRQLCDAVDDYAKDVSETTIRQLELEKRSVTSELKQVAQQMQMVKKFYETKVLPALWRSFFS